MTETAEKKAVSILDENGKYAPLSLVEINKQAQGALIGRKARINAALKEMRTALTKAVKAT